MEIKETKHSFFIPQRDPKGRFMRDEDENIINDEYIYDFSLMTADRMLAGRKLFFISNKEYNNSPKIEDELSALVSRESERQAFAAILMKKIKENEFEKYDTFKSSSFNALKDIAGGDNFQKLMECQDHFFLKVGLQSPELMSQSVDIMSQSVNILKSLKQIEADGGSEMMDLIKTMLANDTELQLKPKSENASTTSKNSKKK